MKIADVSEFYSPTGGGVRSYVHHKLEFAARLGHDLTIIAPGSETRIENLRGGRISWVKAPLLPFDHNYRMFWNASDVWHALENAAPDIVEGSSPWRGGWLAAQWPGAAAKILFMHSDPIASYPQNLLAGVVSRETVDRLCSPFWFYLRRLNSHFDATVVTGEWLSGRFSALGLKHVHSVPLGIDHHAFRPELRDAGIRRGMLASCGLDEEAALLIAVGRHHPEKRLGMLIRATGLVQKDRPAGLYIIGDGMIRRSVEARAATVPHIHVAGRVDDAAKLGRMMASADLLVHGCASETFGLVVAEALCSGTPVVVPDAGGAADLADPTCSEVYPTGDAAAASRAILNLLSRDRETLSRACVAAASARVSTVERHFANLFDLYESVARAKTIPAAA